MNKLRIFLADDHSMLRAGLKKFIEPETDMEVIGEADNGTDALAGIISTAPDVAILDLSMPGIDAVEVAHLLRKQCPHVRILALTFHEDVTYLRKLLEAGAVGYVVKRAAATELVAAIRAVCSGGVFVDPRMTNKLLVDMVRPETGPGAIALSERENQVLRQVAHGYTNKEIAGQLELSAKTVETYKMRSMEKLRLKSRVDVVKHAREQGWLTPPE